MDEIISLSYGNGGKKTSALIDEVILPNFKNDMLNELSDGALINVDNNIAFSSDSFVIDPYFFPGGNIGELCICGTVNDLLMCGSIPKYLSLSLILEEGFKRGDLEKIIKSAADTAKRAGVMIVTGDTKVVDKGHGHGIYINTAGIGQRINGINLGKKRIEKGDKVIISGSVGNHGISVLCARENLLDSSIKSDCAPLNEAVSTILKFGEKVKILRDPTRGGLATTLNEFTENMNYSIELNEEAIPVDDNVKFACDLLGLDPLYSANEGKVISIVSPDCADDVVSSLRKIDICKNASIIGEVTDSNPSKVILKTALLSSRILDKLSSDILPRIC